MDNVVKPVEKINLSLTLIPFPQSLQHHRPDRLHDSGRTRSYDTRQARGVQRLGPDGQDPGAGREVAGCLFGGVGRPRR